MGNDIEVTFIQRKILEGINKSKLFKNHLHLRQFDVSVMKTFGNFTLEIDT